MCYCASGRTTCHINTPGRDKMQSHIHCTCMHHTAHGSTRKQRKKMAVKKLATRKEPDEKDGCEKAYNKE
jgi:hypothetical protein